MDLQDTSGKSMLEESDEIIQQKNSNAGVPLIAGVPEWIELSDKTVRRSRLVLATSSRRRCFVDILFPNHWLASTISPLYSPETT